jgi:voltage-gated potassium channel
MREKIYQIIESEQEDSKISRAYDLFMIAIIVISIMPLAFKHHDQLFVWVEQATYSTSSWNYQRRIHVRNN